MQSYIGIENKNKTIDAIYCHRGASANLQILKEYYKDRKKVEKLIQGGDISYLDKEISGGDHHTFNHPMKGQTIFYHRDNNEELRILKSITKEEYMEIANIFLYSEGDWLFLNIDL